MPSLLLCALHRPCPCVVLMQPWLNAYFPGGLVVVY